jgi:hypothetical protein
MRASNRSYWHVSRTRNRLLTDVCIVSMFAAVGGPSVRAATLAFGAGFGAGSAYYQNQAMVRYTFSIH